MRQFDLEKVEQILKEENVKHKICEANREEAEAKLQELQGE